MAVVAGVFLDEVNEDPPHAGRPSIGSGAGTQLVKSTGRDRGVDDRTGSGDGSFPEGEQFGGGVRTSRVSLPVLIGRPVDVLPGVWAVEAGDAARGPVVF